MRPAILLTLWFITAGCLAAEPLSSERLDEIRASTTPCEQSSETGVCLDAEQIRELTEHSFKEALENNVGLDAPPATAPTLPPEPTPTPQQIQLIESFKSLPWGR